MFSCDQGSEFLCVGFEQIPEPEQETGTLDRGDLLTIGTVAGGFSGFQVDITDIFITEEGSALGSAALAILESMGLPSLDFELSLQGGSGPGYYSFADMIDGGFSGSGGFSGALSVPEPATPKIGANFCRPWREFGTLRFRRCLAEHGRLPGDSGPA